MVINASNHRRVMRFLLTFYILMVMAGGDVMAVISVPADEDAQATQQGSVATQSGSATTPDAIKHKPESESTRGHLLYENHCTSCHESRVHIREKRKAKNFKELSQLASQRADWLNLGWSRLEKNDVIHYLNERYYRYPTGH